MTIWALALLVGLSIAYPAQNAEPARMTALAPSFTMDWWYLAPLAVTDRLGAGALWALTLFGSLGILSVPWWMRRQRRPAAFVTAIRCNACGQCYQDCPYDAISMVPRTDCTRPSVRRAGGGRPRQVRRLRNLRGVVLVDRHRPRRVRSRRANARGSKRR